MARLQGVIVAVLLIGTTSAGMLAERQGPAPAAAPAATRSRAPQLDMSTASSPVKAAVSRADQAIKELQSTLVGRLSSELARGGPAAAVAVCRDEAQQLTASVAQKHALAIGRTSHRLRNPTNTPRPWAEAVVASHAGRKAADAAPMTFDLGGRVGVLRPISTLDFCVTCHGPREIVDAAIGGVLKTAYPRDEAIGFAPGDLRGWIWVEVDVR
jgi:hypothetical protein